MKPPLTGFPRSYRLNDSTDFSRVFESATLRRRGGPLRVLAAPNTMQTARLGLVIGKRAVRRAVDRNRVKRVLRETFRMRRLELPCVDIVVQLTGPVGGCDLNEVFGGLLEQLRNFDR